jgi:hypothetical protein
MLVRTITNMDLKVDRRVAPNEREDRRAITTHKVNEIIFVYRMVSR